MTIGGAIVLNEVLNKKQLMRLKLLYGNLTTYNLYSQQVWTTLRAKNRGTARKKFFFLIWFGSGFPGEIGQSGV